jgi:hypothetical protein
LISGGAAGLRELYDAVKETDVLKMVKEDVLRIMDERKEKVSLEVIKARAWFV